MKNSLAGKRFGQLVVVAYSGVKNKNSCWLCKCDCGKEVVMSRPNLRTSHSCGCLKSPSLIGEKYGKLTVIEFAGKKKGTTWWLCKCDCKRLIVVKRGHLFSGKGGTKSCGCVRAGKMSSHWKGCGDISASFYRKIQGQAKRRKYEFNVGIHYLWDLFDGQGGYCALTGMSLTLPGSNAALHHGKCSASLDRIDSSKGYVVGNVQWVHKDINFMKQKFSQDHFVFLCKKVAGYSEKSAGK